MVLNKKQLIVVVVALALVVLSAIFVPYEGLFGRYDAPTLSKYMGYFSILSPPSSEEIYHEFYPNRAFRPDAPYSVLLDSRIVASRVMIQMATIVLVAAGLIMILGYKKTSRSLLPSDEEVAADTNT